MSISRCMGAALRIAQRPRDTWAAAIDQIPERCPSSDCTGKEGCRERVRDYLRVQYRMLARRQQGAGRDARA